VNVGSPLEEERPDNSVIVDPITGEILFNDSSDNESDHSDGFSYVGESENVRDLWTRRWSLRDRRTPIIWKSEGEQEDEEC